LALNTDHHLDGQVLYWVGNGDLPRLVGLPDLVMIARHAHQKPTVILDGLIACRLLTARFMRIKYA
jgi:hypothetical protein